MLKALLKKQLLELLSGYLGNSNGKKKSDVGTKSVVGIAFVFLFAAFAVMFYTLAMSLSVLINDGYSYVYWGIFGISSSAFGILGSVFLTYNTLYEAKDNDLLLSMPIPAKTILFSRLFSLYLMTSLFEALINIPAAAVYFKTAEFDIVSVISIILNLFILPLLALSISCILGWIIAVISSRVTNKSIFTVVISFAFFAVYYAFTLKINNIVSAVTENIRNVSKILETWLFPFFSMGKGCSGEITYFIVYALLIFALFTVVYFVLSKSFSRLVSTKRGVKRKVYREKTAKRLSAKRTFLGKEFAFWLNTPVYILNCSLGSVLLLIFAVVVIVKKDVIISVFSTMGGIPDTAIFAALCTVMCFIASTNNISGVAISLDAKNIPFIKSAPIKTEDMFFAKIMLHLTVTGIPLLCADIAAALVLKEDFVTVLCSFVFTQLFALLCAETGLLINLRFPKTDWTNEVVPVKQSLSSVLSIMAGMLLSVITVVLFSLTALSVTSKIFFILCIAFCVPCGIVLWIVLKTKGVKMFENII